MKTLEFKDLGTNPNGTQTLDLEGRVWLQLWTGIDGRYCWAVITVADGETIQNGTRKSEGAAVLAGKTAACLTLSDLIRDDKRAERLMETKTPKTRRKRA